MVKEIIIWIIIIGRVKVIDNLIVRIKYIQSKDDCEALKKEIKNL